VNCEPQSYFYYIAITCLLCSNCLLYSHTTITFHSIRLYPLFQANRWDWQPHRKLGIKYLVMLCAGSMLLLVEDVSTSVVNDALVGVLVGYQASPSGVWLFLDTIKPWFLTKGKTCCCAHHTFLLGFPTGRWFTSTHRAALRYFSGAIAGEKEDFCKRSFARTSFTLF
jgi:hypothetical protein